MSTGTKGSRPERDAQVGLQLLEVKRELIEESLQRSTYRDISAFLRGVSTGWDPRASITAKAGIVLCWTGAHIGTEIGAREWEGLERLFRSLLGTERLSSGLRLAEKHLLAALVAATPGEPISQQSHFGLIERRGAGREARRRLIEGEDERCQIGFKISGKRLVLIDRTYEREGYDSRSDYIREVALGQDRSWEMLARGAIVLFWARSHAGERIGPVEWLRLDGLMREHVDAYLFPSEFLSSRSLLSGDSDRDDSSTGSSAVGRSLWRAGGHLLATDPKEISVEAGLPLH